MKTKLTILCLMLSLGVYAQSGTFKLDSLSGSSRWINDNGITISYGQQQYDTVAVLMIVTLKPVNDSNMPVQVTQQKGYSVTPRISYWTLPRATYLNAKKERIPDNYIVWMSVQRVEEK